MKLKRLSALIFCLIMLCTCFAFTACGNKKPQNSGDGEGDGEQTQTRVWTKDDFLIGSWISYPVGVNYSMREQTKVLAESGINFIPYGGWVPDYGESIEKDISSIQWWKNLDSVMRENNIVYNFSALGSPSTEDIKGQTGNMTDTGLGYAVEFMPQLSNCIGVMVQDEPPLAAMGNASQWCRKYRTELTNVGLDVYPFVNLLPSYGGADNIGLSYESYVRAWVQMAGADNIEWLSHDYYAIGQTIDTKIYSDMEILRKVALEYDLKTHAFPQSCAFEQMKFPKASQLYWNVNAYLAYGFKGLTYFNYVMTYAPNLVGNDGIIGTDGKIRNREMYDAVTEINNNIHAFNDTLMNLDCVHAYHTNTVAGTEKLPDNALVSPSENGNSFIISYMRAKDGTAPYITLFNKSADKTAYGEVFTLAENSGITGLQYYNFSTREYEDVQIVNGSFTVNFTAGEIKYFRVSGNVSFE